RGASVEARPEVERDAHVAGPQGVAPASERLPRLAYLLGRVHREPPSSLKPQRISGQVIQPQEREPVARRPVAQARPLAQRSRAPVEFAAGARECGWDQVTARPAVPWRPPATRLATQ